MYLNVWGSEMVDSLVPYLEAQTQSIDIFCFQEATEAMRERTLHLFDDYHEMSNYKFVTEDDTFYQTILIRKSVTLLSSGTLMKEDSGVGLSQYIEVQNNTSSLFICNAHGRARPSEKQDTDDRLRFSSGLIQHFKEFTSPVIIGGDFNLDYETKSVELFRNNGYRDLIREYQIKTTRNHLGWDRFPNKMYYSDYVFLNDAVRLKSFTVQDNEISDHLPMILELED